MSGHCMNMEAKFSEDANLNQQIIDRDERTDSLGEIDVREGLPLNLNIDGNTQENEVKIQNDIDKEDLMKICEKSYIPTEVKESAVSEPDMLSTEDKGEAYPSKHAERMNETDVTDEHKSANIAEPENVEQSQISADEMDGNADILQYGIAVDPVVEEMPQDEGVLDFMEEDGNMPALNSAIHMTAEIGNTDEKGGDNPYTSSKAVISKESSQQTYSLDEPDNGDGEVSEKDQGTQMSSSVDEACKSPFILNKEKEDEAWCKTDAVIHEEERTVNTCMLNKEYEVDEFNDKTDTSCDGDQIHNVLDEMDKDEASIMIADVLDKNDKMHDGLDEVDKVGESSDKIDTFTDDVLNVLDEAEILDGANDKIENVTDEASDKINNVTDEASDKILDTLDEVDKVDEANTAKQLDEDSNKIDSDKILAVLDEVDKMDEARDKIDINNTAEDKVEDTLDEELVGASNKIENIMDEASYKINDETDEASDKILDTLDEVDKVDDANAAKQLDEDSDEIDNDKILDVLDEVDKMDEARDKIDTNNTAEDEVDDTIDEDLVGASDKIGNVMDEASDEASDKILDTLDEVDKVDEANINNPAEDEVDDTMDEDDKAHNMVPDLSEPDRSSDKTCIATDKSDNYDNVMNEFNKVDEGSNIIGSVTGEGANDLLNQISKTDKTCDKIECAMNEGDNTPGVLAKTSKLDEASDRVFDPAYAVDKVSHKLDDALGAEPKAVDTLDEALDYDKNKEEIDTMDERTKTPNIMDEINNDITSDKTVTAIDNAPKTLGTQDDESDDERRMLEDALDEEMDLNNCKSMATQCKVCTSHLLALGKSLEELRKGDQLCDITIITKDTKIRAHKLILCASSPLLQNLIKTGGDQLKEINITLCVSSSAVEVFIHYLYTGELLCNVANMTDLKRLAQEYSVDSLKSELVKEDQIFGANDLKPIADERQTENIFDPQTDRSKLHAKGFDHSVKPKSAQSQFDRIRTDTNSEKKSNVIHQQDSNLTHKMGTYFSVSALPKSKITPTKSKEASSVEDLSKSTSDSRLQDYDDDDDNTADMDYDENSDDEFQDTSLDNAIVKSEPASEMEREASCLPAVLSLGNKRVTAPCNVKVSVEKLPPTINPNVTVLVSDDEDLADREIEFVADKSAEKCETSYTKREFTLEEKEHIALEAKRYGTTQTSKARNIPLPDILSWMTFFGLRKASDNVKQKIGKQVNHEAELSIVRWIVQQQELNGSVNLDAMRNYALAVYRQSQPTFVASKTWLANFFKRNISVLQGTNFIHGVEEENEKTESDPVPVKLTQIPTQVDPELASIEAQINELQSSTSNNFSDQTLDGIVTSTEHPANYQTSNLEVQPSYNESALQPSETLSSIVNAPVVHPEDRGLGGISKELLAKIRSKPIVIGTAVMFDAKTERKLAEWLIERQQQDGYVYRDDFVGFAKSVHKGKKRFQASKGWIQLFMRRNSVKMPLLKEVVFKSKFKTYYTDDEKAAIVQQARNLGVPHVAKMLGINSGVIHSWKMTMDAEERKKGGPKNFEKVTRSVTRAFPSVSKEVDEIIDSSLKERIKASIDVESKRRTYSNPNRGPDPELEREAIEAIKQAEIVRYQDIKRICYEVYSKKRPDFMASRSWVLKFVNAHLEGVEGVEILKSWFDYPEKNQLKLKYADKMKILEEEKIHGVEKVASMRNISCGTIRFWKKNPPSPDDDVDDTSVTDVTTDSGKSKKVRTEEFEYVPSKFQAGKKVRRRVIIGEAVIFTPELEQKLVQWIHDHLMPDNSVYTDDFRQYAKSLYNGDKPFSASSTWLMKFVRRNPVLRGVNFISKYKRYFTEEEKYAAVMEARRFGTSYVAKKLNADSGLINSWKIRLAKYSAKKMARLKQSAQLDRTPLQSIISDKEVASSFRHTEIANPEMTLEEIEKEVGSGLHSHSGVIPVYEREIIQLILNEEKDKGGVTYEDISRLCRSVYERTRPHFKASQNWTRDFIKRHEEALKDVNIENRKKLFIEDDDEPLNHSTARLYKSNRPAEVSPILKKIIGKKPILLGQSRTLEPKMERKLVQWMVQKQENDGYVFIDEFNEYAKSLYKGSKKFAATQAWRIKFFRRNKAALKNVNLQSKYRKQFSREEKMAIVAEARRLGIGHVARKLDVNSSLIYSWGFGKSPQLTQDELVHETIEQDVGKGLYCQRGVVPTHEKDIIRLIHEKQSQEGSVSYDDISKICREIYQETRPSFKASYNWTMDFIRRHKEELKGVDIENIKKVYYENGDEEQPGLESFISTLNQNMDTNISDTMVQIENLEQGQDIDFHAHSYEESDLNLHDILSSDAAVAIKRENLEKSVSGQGEEIASGSSVLERIKASKPDVISLPKTFDIEVEKKMVDWLVQRQARDAYVFTDDFIEFAKSLHTGPDPFSGSQTWRKNFLRRHHGEVKHVIFRSKHVNTYTETEKQMVVEEARKFGIAHVSKKLGLDHRLVWSWKVKADQENKIKHNAFWKGPKKPTGVVAKPLNIKHANANPSLFHDEPLGDAFRGVVPEFEDRIIKMIIDHQNKEGSISYDEISEISRSIYQETRPNFKAGYGWIKNFLQRHRNKLKNIDIENMKKLYLPDDDAFVPASGKNIRDLSGLGSTSKTSLGSTNLASTTLAKGQRGPEPGSSLESLQRIIAKKPIILGTPKSFNIKTEKKLVQWLLEQQAEQGYAFLDEFRDFASSLYTGDKKFAATNAWRTQFFRRNHAALKHVKLVSKFRKTFTEEEKLAIVKEAKRLGVGHVARQLDISHGNINVWMRELEAKGNCSSNFDDISAVSDSSSSSFTGIKQKKNTSVERSLSGSSHTNRERSNTIEGDEEENEAGSGLYSARGIVPIFEKKIVEDVLEYYKTNESIKYDDISRISQMVYKETRPTFKASHNWVKDFMARHAEKLGHLVIQNAREFLTQKEKREVLAEVDKHGLAYVSRITNISSAQLLAWKDQLKNMPDSSSSPVRGQTPASENAKLDNPSVGDFFAFNRSRKYSVEDKKLYISECEKHGITYVSKHYSVPKSNLGRWIREHKRQRDDVMSPDLGPSMKNLEQKVVDWIINRNEEIGVVVVQQVLDFAQATFADDFPDFAPTEEWINTFITENAGIFKNVKFRYPEEVTKNWLNFTQQQKDKLCIASNSRAVVEVAALAGIYPHTLYDWRKWYKKRQSQMVSGLPEHTQTSSELLVPKVEPVELDNKSKMQDKLARVESKYNAVQKQEIADEARKDGTSSIAKKRGIPLPLVLKWMKVFPETVSDPSEPSPKLTSRSKSTPKSAVQNKSTPKFTSTGKLTPKSGSRDKSVPKSTPENKPKEKKNDAGLKVKFPPMTPKHTYNSKMISSEERRKLVSEIKRDGIAALSARTGIPKSTLYHWSKSYSSFEDSDAVSDTSNSRKDSRSSKSLTPDVNVKKETVDLDSFTAEQKREIALETKLLGFEETAKKRGLPVAVVIEWMGLFLESPASDKDSAATTAAGSVKSTPLKRVYTEEERIKVAEQALEIGVKETSSSTGIHISNVRRWMEAYKKRLKERQYRLDNKEKSKSYQDIMKEKTDKLEKRSLLIQGIMNKNTKTHEHNPEGVTTDQTSNPESHIHQAPLRSDESFSFEEKLRILQSADEMGVKNASEKFNVDTSLIFQWRKIYDYAEASGSTRAVPTSTVTRYQPATTKSSDLTGPVPAFTDEFESIVISDDEGSCSPCSNHSWQSDDINFDTSHKRKSDFGDSVFNPSTKKARIEINDSFGTEDNISSDIIDYAYTVEQKQRIVAESNMYGLETVSKMTNIPVSLIISWKAQFPDASVKKEKQ